MSFRRRSTVAPREQAKPLDHRAPGRDGRLLRPVRRQALPVLLALGDFFFFNDESTYPDRTHFIRDIEINSREDLRDLGAEAYGPTAQPSNMT